MNRRSFFQTFGAVLGAATILPLLARAEGRRGGSTAAAGAAKLVDPKDPQAKAVNYVHVNTEVKDKALTADRSGVKHKDQKCKNCVFYNGAEVTVDGKKAASCQMPFASGKVVAAEGWCSSWAKKG